MNEMSAFLQAICAEPDDDALRLVFADWLQEHEGIEFGDMAGPVPCQERAELIRVQVRLARMAMDDAERTLLREMQTDLLARNQANLQRELGPIPLDSVVVERGFITEVRLSLGQWHTHREMLVQQHPIERLQLYSLYETIDDYPNDRCLVGLRELSILPTPGVHGLLEPIVRCEQMRRLRTLDLAGNRIGDQGLIALTMATFLPQLETLDLSANSISSVMPLLLLGSRIPCLKHLNLGSNSLGDRGIVEMLKLPRPPQLHMLDLSGNKMRERGAQVLADSSFVGSLRRLDLSRNSIRNEGAIALAQSRHLRNIEALTLWDCDIESEGARALRAAFGDRVVF